METNLSLKEKCRLSQEKFNYKLDSDKPILLHIDGRSFSKLIKNRFKKPFDDDFIYLRYDKKSMRLHAETPSEQEEHKSLVDANHTDNKPKISKNDSLENVINSALNN